MVMGTPRGAGVAGTPNSYAEGRPPSLQRVRGVAKSALKSWVRRPRICPEFVGGLGVGVFRPTPNSYADPFQVCQKTARIRG